MIIDCIREWNRYEYKKTCECGKIHTILTQEDSFPEYHTDIYVLCECGQYVDFLLPVN